MDDSPASPLLAKRGRLKSRQPSSPTVSPARTTPRVRTESTPEPQRAIGGAPAAISEASLAGGDTASMIPASAVMSRLDRMERTMQVNLCRLFLILAHAHAGMQSCAVTQSRRHAVVQSRSQMQSCVHDLSATYLWSVCSDCRKRLCRLFFCSVSSIPTLSPTLVCFVCAGDAAQDD